MRERELIFLDFETNGFQGTSVLAVAAIKGVVTEKGIVETERYERFYFCTPGEVTNHAAIEINGLTSDVIKTLRGNATYPLYFAHDTSDFIEFCGNCDHFIAHNLQFDKEFMPFSVDHSFCTFLESRGLNLKNGNKLSNLAEHYGIKIESEKLHSAMYDVELLFQSVQAMFLEGNDNLNKFIKEDPFNTLEQKYLTFSRNTYIKSKLELMERFEKSQNNIDSRVSLLLESVKKIPPSKYLLSMSHFLAKVNPILQSHNFSNITATQFNNHLKNKGILGSLNKKTTLGANSHKYGITSEKRVLEDGTEYEAIYYDKLGVETLKKELLDFLLNR